MLSAIFLGAIGGQFIEPIAENDAPSRGMLSLLGLGSVASQVHHLMAAHAASPAPSNPTTAAFTNR